MDRLPEQLSLKLVLAIADEYVSTPAAYAELDAIYGDFKGVRDTSHETALSSVLESAHSGEVETIKLYNIFENAVFKTCFKAESIKRKMLELGAIHSLMSGSGPSVFGIFVDETTAKAAVDELKKEGVRAYYAESVTRN